MASLISRFYRFELGFISIEPDGAAASFEPNLVGDWQIFLNKFPRPGLPDFPDLDLFGGGRRKGHHGHGRLEHAGNDLDCHGVQRRGPQSA